jgi:hypothetical protein
MENQNRVICLNCNIEYDIKEIPISRVGREKETAECLKCGGVIYRGKTSGTFKAIEVENTKK